MNVHVPREEPSIAEQKTDTGSLKENVPTQAAKLEVTNKHFCVLLKEAVKDEAKAHGKDYPKLMIKSKETQGIMTPAQLLRFRNDVKNIIKDEGRHYGILDGYFRYFCKVK
jgi:hypothetical protein